MVPLKALGFFILCSCCHGTPVTLCTGDYDSEFQLIEGEAVLWKAKNTDYYKAPDFVFIRTHRKRLTFFCSHPLSTYAPLWRPRIFFASEQYGLAELPFENTTSTARVLTLPENNVINIREKVKCEKVCDVNLILMPTGHPVIKCSNSDDIGSIDCHVELSNLGYSRSSHWYARTVNSNKDCL